MKTLLKYLFLAVPLLFFHCKEEDVLRAVDPNIQLNLDRETIAAYIDAKGYTGVDTTRSGTRYVILETGSGDLIELNDNVSFYYTIGTSDDSIRYTNNLEIALENNIYDSLNYYLPRIFTYTESTWTISSLFTSSTGSYSETGFKQGLVASMGKMNVGGHAVLMITSSQMYGTGPVGTIPANSVIIMDIFPSKVRHQ